MGDSFSATPSESGESVLLAAKELGAALIGLSLSPKKDVPPTDTMDLLDPTAVAQSQAVTSSLPTRRRDEYRA